MRETICRSQTNEVPNAEAWQFSLYRLRRSMLPLSRTFARQTMHLKTESLFRVSEQGPIAVSNMQGQTGLRISFVHDEQEEQHLSSRGISSRDSRNSFKINFRISEAIQ